MITMLRHALAYVFLFIFIGTVYNEWTLKDHSMSEKLLRIAIMFVSFVLFAVCRK